MRSTPDGFWAVWTSVAVDLLGFGIIIPLLPLYAETFGASPITIGFLFASYSFAQFVFAPIWGRLSDRIGRKPVLLVTIGGSAIGSLIVGLAGSVGMLFAGRVVDGVSGASVAVARATVADQATAVERPRLMGLLGAAFGVGFVIGPAIGSLAVLWGPRVPFFLAAAVSVINLASAWRRVPETRAVGQVTPPRSDRPIGGALPRLVALSFVAISAFAAFEATFSLFADDRLAVGATRIGFVFAGLGILIVISQAMLVGPLTRHVGEVSIVRVGIASNAAGMVLLGVGTSIGSVGGGLVLLAVGQGLLTPTLSSMIAGAVPPDQAGVALGAQQSASGLARVAGPAAGGALYAAGISFPYLAAAALLAVAFWVVPSTEPARA